MKYHFLFITSLILISSCAAMQTIPITRELPALEKKRYISFLTNEEIIVQGKETWDIIDSKTNKTVTTLDNMPDPAKLEIHPNQKIFMIFGKDKIKIYDTKTKKQIKEHVCFPEIRSVQFNLWINDTIYIMTKGYNGYKGQHLLNYNYSKESDITPCFYTLSHKFCVHPFQSSLCYLTQRFLWQSHNKDNLISLPFLPSDLFYSPDGSFIIARDSLDIISIDSSTLNIYKHLTRTSFNEFNEFFENAKMYSNDLLAVLSSFDNKLRIRFYNITDSFSESKSPHSMFNVPLQPIAQTKEIKIEKIEKINSYMLSFSPNGKQCMMGFHDKALLFDLPFEIIYYPEAKKSLTHFLFVLKNYEIQLPIEVINLIVQNSLKTYKR